MVPAAETRSRDRFRGLPIKTEPPIGRFTVGFRGLTREQPETDSDRSLGGGGGGGGGGRRAGMYFIFCF